MYVASPMIGCPHAHICTRSWCLLPLDAAKADARARTVLEDMHAHAHAARAYGAEAHTACHERSTGTPHLVGSSKTLDALRPL